MRVVTSSFFSLFVIWLIVLVAAIKELLPVPSPLMLHLGKLGLRPHREKIVKHNIAGTLALAAIFTKVES